MNDIPKPGRDDVNIAILKAAGFKVEEISQISGPVTIQLDPNALPVVSFSRYTHNFHGRRAEDVPEEIKAVIVPRSFAPEFLLSRLIEIASLDPGFRDRVLQVLTVTLSDDNQVHESGDETGEGAGLVDHAPPLPEAKA